MKVRINIKYMFLVILILGICTDILSVQLPNYSRSFLLLRYIILGILVVLYLGVKKFKVGYSESVIVIAFTIFQILAYMNSYNVDSPNNNFYLYIVWIISYILMFIGAKTIKLEICDIEIFYKVIIFIALVGSVYAIIFQLDSNVLSFKDYNFTMSNIYRSFWGHRNTFGIILVGAIISCMYFYSSRKGLNKMLWLALFFGINLIFTFSRASYLTLAVFLSLYLLLNGKRHKKLLFSFLVIFIICIILYLNYYSFSSFIDKYMIRKNSGLSGRDSLWTLAISFLDKFTFFIGRGIGATKVLLSNDTIGAGVGFHNAYITYLITGGLVQLFIVMRMIYISLRKTLRLMNYNRETSIIILSSIIAFIIYPFFEVSEFLGLSTPALIQTFNCIIIPNLYYKNILIKNYKKEVII